MEKMYVTFIKHSYYCYYCGHMSSNGWISTGKECTVIEGCFSDKPLPPISYQDALQMKDIINHCRSSFGKNNIVEDYSHYNDYDIYECIKGYADELNELVNVKYGFEIVGYEGDTNDFPYDLSKSLDEYIDSISRKISNIKYQWNIFASTLFSPISETENKLYELYNDAIKAISNKKIYDIYTESSLDLVHEFLSNKSFDLNLPIFTISKPTLELKHFKKVEPNNNLQFKNKQIFLSSQDDSLYNKVYALDIAYKNKDYKLVWNLLEHGYYKCQITTNETCFFDLLESGDISNKIVLLKKVANIEYEDGYNTAITNLTWNEILGGLMDICYIRNTMKNCDFDSYMSVSLNNIIFSKDEIMRIKTNYNKILSLLVDDYLIKRKYNTYKDYIIDLYELYIEAFPKTGVLDNDLNRCINSFL